MDAIHPSKASSDDDDIGGYVLDVRARGFAIDVLGVVLVAGRAAIDSGVISGVEVLGPIGESCHDEGCTALSIMIEDRDIFHRTSVGNIEMNFSPSTAAEQKKSTS